MAIEFSIDSKDLLPALKPFFAGKARGKSAALDYVDIKAQKDEVEFASTGLSASLGAEVASLGCARIPFPLFEKLFRMPQSLAKGHLSIHITEGQIKVGPTVVSYPGVSMQEVETRLVDLPIDASLAETLALSFRSTQKDLVTSGLWDRVQAAQERADKLIDRASKLLKPLNIDRDALGRFVFEEIKHPKPVKRLRL